jgi:hypothetical protein
MSAIKIEEAVLAAIAFFDKLYENKGLSDVLLEEIRSVSGSKWDVTLGYNRPLSTGTAKMLTGGRQVVREYKIFTVNKDTGNVESIKIRKA